MRNGTLQTKVDVSGQILGAEALPGNFSGEQAPAGVRCSRSLAATIEICAPTQSNGPGASMAAFVLVVVGCFLLETIFGYQSAPFYVGMFIVFMIAKALRK
jgi:hypothetical protein